MKNSKVLKIINKLIEEEGGRKLALDDKVTDCDLDDMSLIMLQVGLEEVFDILDDTKSDEVQIRTFQNYSVRELVQLCRKSLN